MTLSNTNIIAGNKTNTGIPYVMEGNFLMLWYQNAPVACLRKPSLETERKKKDISRLKI
jgi:hypothetical protein